MSSMKKKGSTSTAAAPSKAVAPAANDDKERYRKMIVAAAEKAPEKIRPYIEQAAPFLAQAVVWFIIALPYIIQGCQMAKKAYNALPDKILKGIIGFLMCFCGGVFPATIAAVEAWSLCGGDKALENCKILFHEFEKAVDASKKDDDQDKDGDGVKDVNQLDAKTLLAHKAAVVLRTVEPEVVNGAVSGIYTGWIGVLAILKMQFAKTVTLGEAIGTQVYTQAQKVEPMIKHATPEEYHHWVPCVVRWTIKSIAIWIAWWVQRVISAVHSAIRGGLMCSRNLLNFANEKGYIQFNDEESELDEMVGWGLAAAGFLFQCYMWFSVPFPLSLLTWPVSFVETFIVYSVST